MNPGAPDIKTGATTPQFPRCVLFKRFLQWDGERVLCRNVLTHAVPLHLHQWDTSCSFGHFVISDMELHVPDSMRSLNPFGCKIQHFPEVRGELKKKKKRETLTGDLLNHKQVFMEMDLHGKPVQSSLELHLQFTEKLFLYPETSQDKLLCCEYKARQVYLYGTFQQLKVLHIIRENKTDGWGVKK